MRSVKKANILVIFLIAILAFSTSSIVYSFTGDNLINYLSINDSLNLSTNKLIIVDDANFVPNHINTVIVQKNNTNNVTNDTRNTTIINNTNSKYYDN
ncbi:MAG: hypothetical protein LBM96_04640 [Methanobrevibacter sp.]|jgi:hypothetical protein|nr:hypothetical protein [Candidatus Methanoflexus mossambicus]